MCPVLQDILIGQGKLVDNHSIKYSLPGEPKNIMYQSANDLPLCGRLHGELALTSAAEGFMQALLLYPTTSLPSARHPLRNTDIAFASQRQMQR